MVIEWALALALRRTGALHTHVNCAASRRTRVAVAPPDGILMRESRVIIKFD